jgi:hypothetical protein
MARAAHEVLALDWLQRDKHIIEGLDHLGIEVVSANIYADLLPGVTNVTDRARYYAFYPWVLHRFAQARLARADRKAWLTWFRRLEFAYAMACAAWEASGKSGAHATAVVGVDAARRVIADAKGKVDLREHADLDSSGKVPAGAYFKNPEGGLGQYYKVALGILGLLREDELNRFPDRQLTTYAGLKVARTLDTQSAFARLVDLMDAGAAPVSELARLGEEVNPSAIALGGEEEQLLRNLFLGEDDDLCRGQEASGRRGRRAALTLALRYVADCGRLEGEFPREFRWACAELALPDGKLWRLPEALRETALAWGAYQRNDAMNYALESLFWVAMRRIDDGRFTPTAVARYVAGLSKGPVKTSEKHAGARPIDSQVAQWVAACARDTGSAVGGPWGPNSTRAWAENLERAIRDEDDAAVAQWAVRVLGRLLSDEASDQRRGRSRKVLERVARTYEVHIGALASRAAQRGSDSFATFVGDLVLEWVLFRHLRVAMRKLAAQGVSTFKFRPEHGALLRVTDKIPVPTYTNPRLRQAHRILTDLHCLSVDEAGATEITADGAVLVRKT